MSYEERMESSERLDVMKELRETLALERAALALERAERLRAQKRAWWARSGPGWRQARRNIETGKAT